MFKRVVHTSTEYSKYRQRLEIAGLPPRSTGLPPTAERVMALRAERHARIKQLDIELYQTRRVPQAMQLKQNKQREEEYQKTYYQHYKVKKKDTKQRAETYLGEVLRDIPVVPPTLITIFMDFLNEKRGIKFNTEIAKDPNMSLDLTSFAKYVKAEETYKKLLTEDTNTLARLLLKTWSEVLQLFESKYFAGYVELRGKGIFNLHAQFFMREYSPIHAFIVFIKSSEFNNFMTTDKDEGTQVKLNSMVKLFNSKWETLKFNYEVEAVYSKLVQFWIRIAALK